MSGSVRKFRIALYEMRLNDVRGMKPINACLDCRVTC